MELWYGIDKNIYKKWNLIKYTELWYRIGKNVYTIFLKNINLYKIYGIMIRNWQKHIHNVHITYHFHIHIFYRADKTLYGTEAIEEFHLSAHKLKRMRLSPNAQCWCSCAIWRMW